MSARILTDLITRLKDYDEMANLVGNRIFATAAPISAERPLIVVETDSYFPEDSMNSGGEVIAHKFDLNCFSDRANTGWHMVEAIRNAYSGYSGDLGSSDIRSVKITNVIDLSILNPASGGQHIIFRYMVSMDVQYRTSVAELG